MKMHKSIKSLSVLLFALFLAGAAMSQNKATPVKKDKTSNIDAKAKQKTDPIERELKLTPKQKEQFKKADKEYKMKSKAVKRGNMEEIGRLQEERKRAQKSVLNAEQAAKYDEMQKHKNGRKAKEQSKHPKKGKPARTGNVKKQKAEQPAGQ